MFYRFIAKHNKHLLRQQEKFESYFHSLTFNVGASKAPNWKYCSN